ncbi:ankyrin repeat-containing domain protein [Xylaria curta]|nr:ankyrin repeat-containing domain protein [Xylaria curta]
MEIIGAIASFIAIGQAIGVTPKIVKTLKAFTNASKEIEALVDELESLYGFYQYMKANIDLFSGEHNTPLLRVDEPPYLKLIRRDFESLTVALQELADSCLVDEGSSLNISKLRWCKKRKNVTKLRKECYKQRQRLQDIYSLFRDRFAYKQGEVLVHIYNRISQSETQDTSALPSPRDLPATPSTSVEEKAIATKSDKTSLDPNIKEAEGSVGRRCRCFCHTSETPTRGYYNRDIRLPGRGFLSYQSQMATGNQCKMNCCTASQSRIATQVRLTLSFGNTSINFRPIKLTAGDKYHLTKFLRFMDMEDDEDGTFEWAYAEGSTRNLNHVWPNTPDILTRRDGYGSTVLHYACAVDNVELVQHLSEFEALLNVTNIFGITPLIMAIANNAWSSAELLIERGCQLNSTTVIGNTPLLCAIMKIKSKETRAVRFAKTLVSRGADLGITNMSGEGVWHTCNRIESHSADLWELYEMMFRVGGARLVNMSDKHGCTPLERAICLYNVPLVSFLRTIGTRFDNISPNGSNILHILAYYGDEQSCDLAAKLEIGCIDIRTTDNYGCTPSACCRMKVERYSQASGDFMSYPEFLTTSNYMEDEPGKREFGQQKLIAFERLLRDIRDRMLIQEIRKLELIILKLRARHLLSARDDLRELVEGKAKAKIDHEAETFRAIDLDVREGRLELAIKSLEEFIEVSSDRMQVSPFDEEVFESSEYGSKNSGAFSEEDSEFTSETDWNSSEGDERPQDKEYGDDEDRKEDGWETADEGR